MGDRHGGDQRVSWRLLGVARVLMVRGSLMMVGRFAGFCLVLLIAVVAQAQSPTPGGMPPPPGMSLAQSAAMRFPQPVTVGTLPGRTVLQPVESQNVIGTVRQVVRLRDGSVAIVIDLGGFLGWGTRPIAVPADAMVLLGQDMEV